MKGFFITIAVVVGLAFYVLTSYGSVAAKAISEVRASEGTPEAMTEAARDEAAFLSKYKPFLERRWFFARIGLILGEDFFMDVSKETLALYDETPLDKDKIYSEFIYERARLLIERGGLAERTEAYLLYKRYVEEFPDGKKYRLADNAKSQLMIKFGFN